MQKILRRTKVEALTGLSRSTIYNLMNEGLFPLPIRIGRGAVGWLESEVDSYISSCIEERDQQASVVGRNGELPKSTTM
ncbi:MAG: AlpA family transcriptional regulator [Candidatus Pacebacteria bacterium]|nr:AlpA family transcriptional regulator [Candidatus Paceibacterota bacterium]